MTGCRIAVAAYGRTRFDYFLKYDNCKTFDKIINENVFIIIKLTSTSPFFVGRVAQYTTNMFKTDEFSKTQTC